MNPSLQLISHPSTVSPCLHPLQRVPLSLPRHYLSSSKVRRLRFSISCISSTLSASNSNSLPPNNIFGDKRELNDVQALVERLPKQARIAASVVITATALAAGYGLGLKYGKTRNIAIGSAAAAGLIGTVAVSSFNNCAPEVAAIALHNRITEFDDPKDLKKEDVEDITKKYGVNKDDGAFVAELRDIYCRFVTSVLPPGGKDLEGNEAEIISNFKNALGIDDPDAASMHMEIGRRIYRERLEKRGGDGDSEQRRAFQKLIYVSNLVFGKASAYLLPWKRVFKITDAQVDLAIRDNAQRLYALKLRSIGRDVDAEQLINLRLVQLQYNLPDEIAAELFKQRMGSLVNNNVSNALDILKSNTRSGDGIHKVVQELEKVLQLNNKLISLGAHRNASSFASGVGPITLPVGEFTTARRTDDLKLLYSVYVTDALSGGFLEEHKHDGFVKLPEIFNMKKEEAEAVSLQITSKVYRRCLAHAFTSGELDIATSKASFLNELCNKLYFDPQLAAKVHEEIYRQKLKKSVPGGHLSENDASALERIRVLLCVSPLTVENIHSEICGNIFDKVVYEAIASGVEGFDEFNRRAVVKSIRGLRMTRELAVSIASKSILKMFLVFVKRSRVAKKRVKRAEELKKLLSFNSLVATALLRDIKSEFPDADSDSDTSPDSPLEDSDLDEDWQSLETLKKAKAAENLPSKPFQTEINLKGEIPIEDRTELYKKYLINCIAGKVVALPFGPQLPIKSDNSEYVYLNQLGALLGLSAADIARAHRSLAERAFQKRVEKVLADGRITKAKIDQLEEIQKNIGLPQQYAQEVVKNITSTKIAAALQSAMDRGSISINQIREMKEANVDLNSLVNEKLREELFRKTIADLFSSGTGEFDSVEVYENIVSDLSISLERGEAIVEELARARARNSLVEGVAMLRRKNREGVVMMINDLIACDKAVPSQPLIWERSEEFGELFAVYLGNDPTAENVSRLQYLFGLSDDVASGIRETVKVKKENVLLRTAEEENFVF